MDNVFLERIALKNILTLRDMALEMRNLNVLIGPNGSGKSNFIEVLDLLRAAPGDLLAQIQKAGGIRDLTWKGHPDLRGVEIAAVLNYSDYRCDYRLRCEEIFREIEITESLIDLGIPRRPDHTIVFERKGPKGTFHVIEQEPNSATGSRDFVREDLDPGLSVLAQIRDPVQYGAITLLGRELPKVRVYRSAGIGPNVEARRPQRADLRNDFVREDGANLGLVLNRMERDGSAVKVEKYLERFLNSFKRLSVQVEGGTVQIFLAERDLSSMIPASRISDGTLSFLRLMAILCHPEPPPLVCIEEPEVGLHPDALQIVGEAIQEASRRTQLVVTTHSEALVDALSDEPESVIACEKAADGSSDFRRLSRPDLDIWLEEYSLGRLWRKGEIGANP